MSNILIINAHHKYPFAEGRLNGSLVQMADEVLTAEGHVTRVVTVDEGWKVETELENHQWADVILLQSPVNWMGMPWTFKQYMDEVYTAGMGGQLCDGDGRHRNAPEKQYGSGGTLGGKKYMLSLTFNAPEESFDDVGQFLFQGKGVDDLLFPMHMNFRFFAMEPLPTFACFDVMKNPDVGADFDRYRSHLIEHIPS
jgi:modulator of drug activity B